MFEIKKQVRSFATAAAITIFCLSTPNQVQAGWNDMPAPLFTRGEMKSELIPAEKSQILKGVKFLNPKTIANNVYFQQADAIADMDMLRAAHWLVSIVYEADNDDSDDVNILCSDACRALVVLHEAIAEKKLDRDEKFTHIMYAAISADIGAFSLADHRGDSFVLSAEAYSLYKKALKLAEDHNLNDGRVETLRKLIKESEADIPVHKVASFIQDRVSKLRFLFKSSTIALKCLHDRNIEHLKRPSPLQQIEMAIQKAASAGNFDEVAKLSAQRAQLMPNRDDDDA